MRDIPSLLSDREPAVDAARLFTREWYSWLDRLVAALRDRVPVAGTVTFAAATTAAVTLPAAQPDTSYTVVIEAPEDRRVWVTSKTTTGFTINVSSSSSAAYGWALVRR